MTTITAEVRGDLLPRAADDPKARDRERQWLEEEIQRIVLLFLDELQRAGFASIPRPDHVDVLIQEKDSGRLLVVEAKTSHGSIEHDDFRDHGVAKGPASLVPDEAERQYQGLGRWKGPLAVKDVQRDAQAYWERSGSAGARWLVGRLRNEVNLDRLHGAASLLADLGDACIVPIFEALAGEPPRDQAQALLWALDSLIESEPALRLEGAREELALADLLQHDDSDLRESAARAMGLLRPERAARWLERRLRDETDAEVRRTIEEEIHRQQAGRT